MYKCKGNINYMEWIPEIKICSPEYRNQYREIFNVFIFSLWESLFVFQSLSSALIPFFAGEIGKFSSLLKTFKIDSRGENGFISTIVRKMYGFPVLITYCFNEW